MNTKRASKNALAIIGALMLFYIGYGLTHPPTPKARAARFTGLNAAPPVTVSFPVSNAPAPASTLPNTAK
jgi:hypothetical protein